MSVKWNFSRSDLLNELKEEEKEESGIFLFSLTNFVRGKKGIPNAPEQQLWDIFIFYMGMFLIIYLI